MRPGRPARRANRPERTPVGAAAGIALGALALASIVLGFYQGPLGRWLTW